MRPHVTRTGQGPRIVLLHGWALNSHVWDDMAPQLARHFTVECVDLPGHGLSPWMPFHDLESLAATLRPVQDGECVLLGWSLGSLVALQMSLTAASQVRALVAVAGTPKFLNSDDWHEGVDADVLDSFAARLAQDFEGTVRDFLGLQVQGSERARETLRALRRKVLEHGAPAMPALVAGLEVLRTADLRDALSRIRVPTLVIAGERDRLTPPDASRELAQGLPRARFHLVEGAAHAPFLSHPDEFLREVLQFLARVTPTERKAGMA
jgi:pimeloyl-[acyl-carrier protein] methyl ester esterase